MYWELWVRVKKFKKSRVVQMHPKPYKITCIPIYTRLWHPGQLGTLGATSMKSRLSCGRRGTRQLENRWGPIKTDKKRTIENPEDRSPDRMKARDGDKPWSWPRVGSKPRRGLKRTKRPLTKNQETLQEREDRSPEIGRRRKTAVGRFPKSVSLHVTHRPREGTELHFLTRRPGSRL